MVSQAKPKNHPPVPARLSADSRLTTKQAEFAKLIATGLNSASSAYRQAYNRSATGEWWCRQQAYQLLQKPHIQALVTKLKAQYDAVRPALTRLGKREILHGMAIDTDLEPMDRQRAVDIDNKMQGEYQERMHLTADVTISMFRGHGAIPWQLAEDLPKDVKLSPTEDSKTIDVQCVPVVMTAPDGGTGTLAIADSSHSKAIPSDLVEQAIPTPQPAQPATPQRKQTRKLKPLELAALRKHRVKR